LPCIYGAFLGLSISPSNFWGFLIMNKQDFVTYMTENGMTGDNATKMYDHLNERFDGDWKEAAEYLTNMVAYLEKHQ
jgi:hypothetical protein